MTVALYQDPNQISPEPAAYGAHRALTASSAKLNMSSRTELEAIRQRHANSMGWQVAAWQCYSYVGEVNYAFNYSAAILSRIRFHAAVVVSEVSAPVDIVNATQVQTNKDGSTIGAVRGIDPRLAQRAEKFMRDLGKHGNMAVMAKAFALNLQVAGECYMVCINGKWSIRSTMELKIDAGNHVILQPSMSVGTLTPRRLRKGTPVGRIWNQHPQYSADPDSSLRSVILECEELILLARLMRVTARSRLNAGILYVPDELSASARTMGGTDDDDDIENNEDQDEFEKELFQSLTAPIAHEEHSAAIVPLLVRGPADQGTNIKYIQLARDVGSGLETRSEKVLTRVLQGINAPKELATGMSQSRYNNAQMIDQQSYKALVEPLALVFSDAITDIYLRTMLKADIEDQDWADEIVDIDDQLDRIVCWYDPSEVVTAVDQAASAGEGWDRDCLSDAAWRKANGYGEDAKPSEQELARRVAMKQVAMPPDLQETMFKRAFPHIFEQAQAANESANGVGMPPDLSSILQGAGGDTAASVAPSPPVSATSVPQGV